MDASKRQAEVALRAYLERGWMALEQLAGEHWDDAEVLLKWREAAFYEFRAVDHINVVDGGFSTDQGDSLCELWREVEEVNEKLQSALARALDKMKGQLVKMVDRRKKLAKFHSGMDRN